MHFNSTWTVQMFKLDLEKAEVEKEMATHSSIIACKSPWTEEPGRLQSMGLHDWACVHEGGGRWVGSNKVVELKKKKKMQRNQRSNCQHPLDHTKSKRVPEKHLLLLYWLCQNLCVNHNKLWKILKEMRIPDHLTCLLRNLYAGQEATIRTRHGTTDQVQIGKGVCQGCILSPCLFNYMQSTSWEMLDWMKHKLESRLPGEISITSETQMIPPLWQKVMRN